MNKYIVKQVHCASCGGLRDKANHWFIVVPGASARVTVSAVPRTVVRDVFEDETVINLVSLYTTFPYSDSLMADENALPACGQSCLAKLQSELLHTNALDKAQTLA